VLVQQKNKRLATINEIGMGNSNGEANIETNGLQQKVVARIGKNYVFWSMTRYLLTALILSLRLAGAPAQQPVHYVELTPPKHKVSGSLYRHIEFMDSRPDTFLIGPIQIGPFGNIDARLAFKDPTTPQLEQFMSGFIDSTAQDGTLLLQLRDLSFVEPIKVRYLFIKATLYARTDSGYRKLSTLDVTDVLDGSGLALTVNSVVNGLLDGCIAAALKKSPTNTATYALTDIARIDSVEEYALPLYSAGSFVDGIYRHYTSFSKQLPDQQGTIKAKKDGTISSVYIVDTGSNKIKLRPKDLYAVVYKGRPYIATEYGFYPLERVRDNFFFTGDIRVAANSSDYLLGFGMTGLIGVFVASRGYEETYDLLIDPLNGNFIHLRRIDKQQTP
jgi:hypothetical protein